MSHALSQDNCYSLYEHYDHNGITARLERLEREQVEKRLERLERLETERVEKERMDKLETERVEKERMDKLETERVEKERMDKLETERVEKEKQARLETERVEKERLAGRTSGKERLERLETERVEKRKESLKGLETDEELISFSITGEEVVTMPETTVTGQLIQKPGKLLYNASGVTEQEFDSLSLILSVPSVTLVIVLFPCILFFRRNEVNTSNDTSCLDDTYDACINESLMIKLTNNSLKRQEQDHTGTVALTNRCHRQSNGCCPATLWITMPLL